MKKISWYLCFLFISSAVLLSCSDDDDDDHKLSLEFISEDVTSASLEVENFTMTDAYSTKSGDETIYMIAYTFEIHNNTDNEITLEDHIVQNYIAHEGANYAASGYLSDFTIPANGFRTVQGTANSSMVPDPLNIDGYHLLIYVYDTDINDYLIKLDFQINIDH